MCGVPSGENPFLWRSCGNCYLVKCSDRPSKALIKVPTNTRSRSKTVSIVFALAAHGRVSYRMSRLCGASLVDPWCDLISTRRSKQKCEVPRSPPAYSSIIAYRPAKLTTAQPPPSLSRPSANYSNVARTGRLHRKSARERTVSSHFNH